MWDLLETVLIATITATSFIWGPIVMHYGLMAANVGDGLSGLLVVISMFATPACVAYLMLGLIPTITNTNT